MKGKKIVNPDITLSKQLSFVALDIETTGLDQDVDEIIEIAALRFSEGKIVEKYSVIIKPQKSVPVFIKKLTNITDRMLANGIKIQKALNELLDFVGNSILLCHNARFDVEFINTKLIMLGKNPLNNIIYDTLILSKIYLPDSRNHKLITLCDYFDIDLKGAHRAINDAEATGYLLMKILDFIQQNIDVKTNHLLKELSERAEEYSDLTDLLNRIVELQQQTTLLKKQTPWYNLPDHTYIEKLSENNEIMKLNDVFEEKGSLAQVYENYEFRAGQLEMAKTVKMAFEGKNHLLVEAGTGIGKSLAYLVPAVQYSHKNECRIIISTNTKNLQEQLFTEDLPWLQKCLKIPFKAVLLKGRSNYICEKKWQEVLKTWKRSAASWEIRDLMKLIVWKKFTKTGDIVENYSFDTGRMSATWKKVVADRHFCRGRRCPLAKSCYFMQKRILAEEANLVIINHHLLLADAIMDNSALGEYKKVVIDEAHNLPNTAHSEFGYSLSWPDIHNFFLQLFHIRKDFQGGELISLKRDLHSSDVGALQKNAMVKNIDTFINIIEESRGIIKPFFWEIGKTVKKTTKYGKLSFYQNPNEYKSARLMSMPDLSFIDRIDQLLNCLQAIKDAVNKISKNLKTIESSHLRNYDQYGEILDRIDGQVDEISTQLQSFQKPDYDAYTYWFSIINVEDDEYPAGVLNVVPLVIDKQMAHYFYDAKDSIIFTSATLAIRGIFKYYERRMGISLNESNKFDLKIVDSPFDYNKQSLVINTAWMPHYTDPFFFLQSIKLISKLSEYAPGGTLVLFTSYSDMDRAYKSLTEELPSNINLMIQSRTSSRSSLLKQFKEDGKGVLLGTSSFWEGVDVPGEALSQIIIYKLPFPSPGDPIVEGINRKLLRDQKRPFEYYTLPEALLKYRQGYGRLIRSKSDKGVIIVLDNRISTKRDRYGKYFIKVIPAETIFTSNAEETISIAVDWYSKYNFDPNN